jgi:hypothetical protein
VEKTKKNIQVLTGLPSSQLGGVMDYFATSLGVRCNHCHVIDSTGWQTEKDDKQPKKTARKMIQMVMDLNNKNFGGRKVVTCYTCHRGSTEPTKLIPLPQASAKPRPPAETGVPSYPSVEQVLGMYEQALGGTDAMKKITSRVSKGVSIDEQGREAPVEIIQTNSGKYSTSTTMRDGGQMTHTLNGSLAWMVSPRGARELSPPEMEYFKANSQFFPLPEMRGMSKNMHISTITTIRDTRAYLLEAPVDEHTTERYYIDSAKGLLLRKESIMHTLIGDIPEQTDYSDYRTVDGVTVPFMIQTAAVDPRDGSTEKYTSITHNGPIDEKIFVMPEIKQQPPRRR